MEAQFPCAVALKAVGSKVKHRNQRRTHPENTQTFTTIAAAVTEATANDDTQLAEKHDCVEGYVHDGDHAPAGLDAEAVSLQTSI